MRGGVQPLVESTLGSYLRGERNLKEPFGYYELPGFALLVRCTLVERGDGCEESVRIKAEFRPSGAKLKQSANPEAVIDWPHVSPFDPALRKYACAGAFNFCEPHKVYLDGNGAVRPE